MRQNNESLGIGKGISPEKSRSNRPEVFCKKGVLRNFAKFTGKHLLHSLFFDKKETLVQVFSCEFCELFKNTFSYRTPPVLASERHLEMYLNEIAENKLHLFPT